MASPRKPAGGFRVVSNALFLKHLPRRDRHVERGQYTALEALLSLHRDLYSHGKPLSERAYERIWRRGRKWVRARLAELEADPVYQQGYQEGDQRGDHQGYQLGDQPSGEKTGGCGGSGYQQGYQEGDQQGYQEGTTTLKREDTETERERRASAPPSSLSDLLALVLEERPEWSEQQREAWVHSNLPRLEDAVNAKAPRDRKAALRDKARRWARAERETPGAAPSSEPRTTRDRVLAHLHNAYPEREHFAEEHVEAHWKHFGGQCEWGPYQPPGSETA